MARGWQSSTGMVDSAGACPIWQGQRLEDGGARTLVQGRGRMRVGNWGGKILDVAINQVGQGLGF